MTKKKPPKFHAAIYNMVAKVIREEYAKLTIPNDSHLTKEQVTKRVTQAYPFYGLMLNFCSRFLIDNPENFDPIKFLDQCSPDEERFPFSELWESELNQIAENGS